MFDGKYFDWNQKRVKAIIDFYGYKFFYFKRLLDLGCGYGDMGGVLYRLGSDVTGVDARQEHLKVVGKKYTGIKTVQANLDDRWPFHGQKWDIILDLGLLCHLQNFEKHLNAVSQSCTHLVLETAVCDSDDPYKVVTVDEDKGTYDLSYTGKGSRPSPAAIERVLREAGMNFKRMDNSKFNSGDYVYDWYPRNDNSTNLSKRRIWFCVKGDSPIQFANPNSELAYPPITADYFTKVTENPVPPQPPSHGFITPEVGEGPPPPKTSVSPKPPMSARMEAEARARAAANNPQSSMPEPSPIRTRAKALSLNDKVRQDSREFSLITPDEYKITPNHDVRGIVLPTTHSSRMWFKKIAPFLPNVKLSNKAISMPNFSKTEAAPTVVMCSLDNLCVHSRVFIDEWVGPALTPEHIEILKKCSAIITPSLLNAQEIWRQIPHASVLRFDKNWPAMETDAAPGNYFIYFEKSAELTGSLLQAWDPQWGDLVVVGSSIKLPTFAKFVSDSEPYTRIMSLILGAKAVIDLPENNYYLSGIANLANDLNLPIISNNHSKMENNFVLVQNDRRVSFVPTIDNIKTAMAKFNAGQFSKPNLKGMERHNNILIDQIRKIIG